MRNWSLVLLVGFVSHASATDIGVQFDAPGNLLPLRLNQASNGWTHAGWSQYYDDIGVQYRRMDHWNNAYNPIRRRPDGGMWYDLGALDNSIYYGTGGFNIKAYPTVDYCPACLDTEFLQNPLELAQGTVTAALTATGTLYIAGKKRESDPTGGTPCLVGAPNDEGTYEVDRKGNILAQYPLQHILFATPANHIVIKTDSGYSVLGPDRKEIASGKGVPVQEIDGTSLLLGSGGADDSREMSQVDLKGNVIKKWDGKFPLAVVLTKAGLVTFGDAELFLFDASGKRSIQKFPPNSTRRAYLAMNPLDPENRFYAVVSDDKNKGTVYAFSADAQLLWKSDTLPGEDVRGLVASKGGIAVMSTGLNMVGVDKTGILWKVDTRGGLNLALVSSLGMETVVTQTYEDEIDEHDIRTGEPLWRYGQSGDTSYWICKPPHDLVGWQDSVRNYIKHYNKDLGLGWDRWELWNEPSEHGYFWQGTWQDYAATLDVTMKAVADSDPSIIMDAYDGSGWWMNLMPYCNDHKVRLDSISWHGYRDFKTDYVADEQKDLKTRFDSFSKYTGGTLQLANTEWNVHPGSGDDHSNDPRTGYYHAPFLSEMTYLMGKAGVKFTSEFAMVSAIKWPDGYMYTSDEPIGGQTPDKGTLLHIVTPAYSTARLWAMLPKNEAPVTNDFQATGNNGWTHHVEAIAASDPDKGEYGVLVWNYSNQAPGAKDEDINLGCTFKGESKLHVRHFVIDADHSTYTKDWQHQWLEAVESGVKSASDVAKQTVTLKKDSLHAFFFTRDPLKANAGKNLTVEAHHPVHFDGSMSTGMPLFYRWNVAATGAPDFPAPDDGMPSSTHLYGPKPVLVKGYDKPGTYTVTLRVSADGYDKETDLAKMTVTVVPETTKPDAPQNLSANTVKTDHQVFLTWDSLNFAKNPDVTGFAVYRKGGGEDWKKLATTTMGSTAYVDSGVTEKTPYSYRVAAVDSSGNESVPSPEIAATFLVSHQAPKTPVAVKAEVVAPDTVKIDWDNESLADAACVKAYNVYRRPKGSSDWQKLTSQPVLYKRYYDTITNAGMAGASEYCITAVDAFANESLQSDAVLPAEK